VVLTQDENVQLLFIFDKEVLTTIKYCFYKTTIGTGRLVGWCCYHLLCC